MLELGVCTRQTNDRHAGKTHNASNQEGYMKI